MAVGFYSAFTIGHDGDFCNYVSVNEKYDLIVNGLYCDLTPNWFIEPLVMLVAPNVIVQIGLLAGFLLVDKVIKVRH